MMGTGMGPRLREDNGRGRGWIPAYRSSRGQVLRGGMGWVPAFARTTGGGEDQFPPTVFAGAGSPRDDGDGDGSPPSRGQREGERINSRLPFFARAGSPRGDGDGDGLPPTVFARAGSSRDDGDGDGSPPSRGQREGEGMDSRLPSSRGQVLRGMMGAHGMTGGEGMGPRLREDNGRGRGSIPAYRLREGRFSAG